MLAGEVVKYLVRHVLPTANSLAVLHHAAKKHLRSTRLGSTVFHLARAIIGPIAKFTYVQ